MKYAPIGLQDQRGNAMSTHSRSRCGLVVAGIATSSRLRWERWKQKERNKRDGNKTKETKKWIKNRTFVYKKRKKRLSVSLLCKKQQWPEIGERVADLIHESSDILRCLQSVISDGNVTQKLKRTFNSSATSCRGTWCTFDEIRQRWLWRKRTI